MGANIAASPTDGSGSRKAAMSRDLEDRWARFADDAGSTIDPATLDIMRRVYWYGVTTGVGVFCKAIDGAYP
jgi:hypothetical protein